MSSPSFVFPEAVSTVLPNPSLFFSPHLLSSPLPTNSFFQNFVLKNGDQPEYIHPYLIKSSLAGLSLCYPSRISNPSVVFQPFNADLTISNSNPNLRTTHVVSAFSDLSITLDQSNLRFFLVRGCPFLTCDVIHTTQISISTIHAILVFSSNSSRTKHMIGFNNNQTWIIYSSSPMNLMNTVSEITSEPFSGVIRIAALLDSKQESVLDLYSSCYPISGQAAVTKPFCVEYKWRKKGLGDLLMLANHLHLQLLETGNRKITVLDDFRYGSIDGELVGVVGDSWRLNSTPIPLTWHSIGGIKHEGFSEIVSALIKDVDALINSAITTTSSYFYGKLIARAARLVLIAEEVYYPDVIPLIIRSLKTAIEPWLNGSFLGNGFAYENKWKGIVTRQGLMDSGADFGFGIYNDHHYHLGYFLYAIAVVAKIDPAWGKMFRPQAYSLMADFMTVERNSIHYPPLRCFDFWKLHSWAGGLTEFGDGRNQESTSEAMNAYYSAALLGFAYGDVEIISAGSTLVAFEIHAAREWWHVKEGDEKYGRDFVSENRMVGVAWANKRDSSLWFAPPEWKECRVGIQILPLSPATEILFADVEFVREVVKWTMASLGREGVGEGWKGFVYAMEGIYDKEEALSKVRRLNGFDDGNSLANILWWIYSRD